MKRMMLLVMVGAMGLLLSGCGQLGREKVNEYPITLGSHAAVSPVPREGKGVEWWPKRHEQVLERIKSGPVDMIFIGDSITHGWDGSGTGVWDRYYAGRNAVNMGFSGDKTEHVLWRLYHGEIEGIAPKLAVLMIGTNNSGGDAYSAEEIAEGIIAICQKLRADLPGTKILILSIFPRGETPNAGREKNAEASQLAGRIADGKWIYTLDIGDNFLEPDGRLPKEIMPDFLHPNGKGYQIWAEAMEPMVAKLLGEKDVR